MGIHSVSPVLDQYRQLHNNKRHLSKYTGYVVVVDAFALIYRHCIGQRSNGGDIVDIEGRSVNEQFACLKIVVTLLRFGITPVFVFDGEMPEIKQESVKRRKKQKQETEQRYKELCDKLTTTRDEKETEQLADLCKKMYMRSFKINHKNIVATMFMLKEMGIPVIEAPYEADSQCCAIARFLNNEYVAVLTDDVDVLLYGVNKMLMLSTLAGNCIEEFDRSNFCSLFRDKLPPMYQEQFTHEHLIEICLLMGTDYCNGIKKSVDKIIDFYVQSDMEITDKRLDSISDSLTYDDFCAAKQEYIDPSVHQISLKDITMKKPRIPFVLNVISKFLSKQSVKEVTCLLEKNYEIYSALINEQHISCGKGWDAFTSYNKKWKTTQTYSKLCDQNIDQQHEEKKQCHLKDITCIRDTYAYRSFKPYGWSYQCWRLNAFPMEPVYLRQIDITSDEKTFAPPYGVSLLARLEN